MLRIVQSRFGARAAYFAIIASFTMSHADEGTAGTRQLRAPVSIDIGVEFDPPKAPARFFTISAVLAKRDAGKRPGSLEMASLVNPGTASDANPAPVTSPVSDLPFGLFAFRAPEGVLWTKWRAIQAQMASDRLEVQICRINPESCGVSAKAFGRIVAMTRGSSLYDRAQIVNREANAAVRYVSDFEQFGVADRWSAPLATLTTGLGDCEDYAILKYMLLRESGVASSDLKLLLVHDKSVHQDHAVLGVRIDGRWLVLDNRQTRLLEANHLDSLVPLFLLDHQGVSLFAAPYASRIVHESEMDFLPATEASSGGPGSALPLAL